MGDLILAWESAFQATHPEVKFENAIVDDQATLGGLYTGVADLAVLDRPPLPIEVDGYQQGTGHDPTGVAIATGSVRDSHHAAALAVVVPLSNPLRSITLAQLDAVFDADHRRGMDRVHTWGELGLTEKWKDKPVHLYGFGLNSTESFLFERDVMQSSQKWREGIRELATPQAISRAVALDPAAIGITSMDGLTQGVRVLAITNENGEAVIPTPEALRAGKYALERSLFAYWNRDAAKDTRATVREFIEFCLSGTGQQATEANGFLPLNRNQAAQSREAAKQ